MAGTAQAQTPPAEPGLTAAAGNEQVKLDWTLATADGSITKWQVCRKTGNATCNANTDADWSDISGATAATRTHTVTGLTNNTEYKFRVRAVNPSGNGTPSDQATATPVPPPAEPQGFTAASGNASVALAWTGPTDSTITSWQYRQRTTSTWGAWTEMSEDDAVRSYTVTGLTNNTQYTFQIRAVNDSGDGTASDEMSATPAAPFSIRVGTLTAGASEDLTGFRAQPSFVRFGSLNAFFPVPYPDKSIHHTAGVFHNSAEIILVLKHHSDGNRLHQALESTLKLLVGSTAYDLSWDADNERYKTAGIATSPFTSGQEYSVSLTTQYRPAAAKPQGFTAMTGDTSVALAWTGPTDRHITKWQYRKKAETGSYGDWTDIPGSHRRTNGHTVSGLNNNTQYTFQIRAVSGGVNGAVSDEASATPKEGQAVLDTTMTVGHAGGADGNGVHGYSRHAVSNLGSIGDNTFTHDGTDYTLVDLYQWYGAGNSVCFRTTPQIPLATLKSLSLTFKDKTLRGRWATPSGYSGYCGDNSGLSLTENEVVAVALGVQAGEGPSTPTGFTATAGNASVALAWTGPADDHITKWQYRQKADTGSYGAWTDIPDSDQDTRSYTVDSLVNGAQYTFQIRSFSTAASIASVEKSATPSSGGIGNGVPGSVNAEGGNGQVRVSWQPPDGNAGGEGASGSGAASAEDAPEAPDASDLSYEVAWTQQGEDWSDGGSQTVDAVEATVSGLENGQSYAFRVRAMQGGETSAWSETVHATPAAPGPSLLQPFADLALANGSVRGLAMAEHFSGSGLSYEVLVTTTHKRTGEVKTAPINTVARNKVRGAWSDDVLALTAGPSGHHVLTLAVTATDGDGETASDSFQLTVDATGMPGRPDAPTAVAGDGEIAVSWTAPSEDGGLTIASYDLDIGIGGDWSAGPATVTGLTGTSRTVTGLTNGTSYSFRIRAVNSAGAGEWSEPVASTPQGAGEVAVPAAPTGLEGTTDDGEVALAWTAPADDGGAGIASYEVDIGIGGNWSAGPDTITGITGTSKTVTGLANGTAHDFRVRAVNSAGAGAWSETVSVTPVAPATLILALPDLELANGEVHTIDMTEHFTGTGLTDEVMVTTTHKRTGQVKTGPINTVARNKVRGAWSGHVLTLTAGPSGHHVLGMEVIATDLAGGTASDEFQLTVGTSETESLAAQALKNALASQARSMLEDASSAIGGRMQSGVKGTDALTAFAGLFGGGRGVGDCPLDESLEECMARDADHRDAPRFGGTHGFGPLSFDWNREDEGGGSVGLSEFRDRVNAQGFAVSLNQPLAFASSADGQTGAPAPGGPAPEAGMALTFWGRGAASSGVTDTVFWGLDASMGEQWMAGLAFAESGAEVTQSLSRGALSVSGFAESDISAVYPYLRSHFGSGLEVWSLMGWGSGRVDSRWTGASLTSASEETVHLDGEVAFDLGLVGAEQTLFEGEGFSLLALGDAGWSRLAATSGRTQGIEATVSRTRLGVEGRYVSGDGALSSGLRAGARVDGGDGQTASGMELLGDVRRTWGRWQAGIEGRWYAADTADAGHGSQGVKATLALQPRTNGTGLGLTISPGWGTQSEAVKQDGLLAAFEEGAPGQGSAPAAHLDGRLSWGMRLPGQGLYGPGERLSPYAEFSFAEDGTRHLRTGLALEGPVGMGLALERRESPTDAAEHGIMLRLDTRF